MRNIIKSLFVLCTFILFSNSAFAREPGLLCTKGILKEKRSNRHNSSDWKFKRIHSIPLVNSNDHPGFFTGSLHTEDPDQAGDPIFLEIMASIKDKEQGFANVMGWIVNEDKSKSLLTINGHVLLNQSIEASTEKYTIKCSYF